MFPFPYSVGVSWRLCSCGVGLVQSGDVVMESCQCNLGGGVCVRLRDKIWEWPGNKARRILYIAECILE